MPDYQKMYWTMMKASEEALKANQQVAKILIEAQRECERIYVYTEEPDIRLFIPNDEQNNT